jgi:hypothetical protein
MERVMRAGLLWAFALSVTTIFALSGAASAGGTRPFCRAAQDADNPMMTSSSFGLATCNARRAPRYHSDDYAHVSPAAAASLDPMVWAADQWAGDLFGYSTGYDDRYDRRLRSGGAGKRIVHGVVEINVEAVTETKPSHGFKVAAIDGSDVRWTVYKTAPRAPASTSRGARIWSGGKGCDTCRGATVVRAEARCRPGVALVISWTEGAAQYRCSTPRALHRWVK